jgi:hypothetical protein
MLSRRHGAQCITEVPLTQLLVAYDCTTLDLAQLSCSFQSSLSNGMLENGEHVSGQAENTSSHHMFRLELKTQLAPFFRLSQYLAESPRISLCTRRNKGGEIEATSSGPERLGFVARVCPILSTFICDRHVQNQMMDHSGSAIEGCKLVRGATTCGIGF